MRIDRLKPFWELMRFHKPVGIFLLLWPCLWALWIAAQGMPDILILCIFLAGTVVMRTAGCVINDVADRHWDGHVKRTCRRPLVTGAVTTKEALILFVVLMTLAVLLVCWLNPMTIALSSVAAILAILYPFTKRWTHWPQLILGMAFSWSIPMAFSAELNTVPPIAWLLFSISVLWTLTYDTEYAMMDREDDLRVGIKSTAVLFGKYDRRILMLIHWVMLGLLIWLGLCLHLHIIYYSCLLLTAGLLIYQQRLIRHPDPRRYQQAFLSHNALGLLVFIGLIMSYVQS